MNTSGFVIELMMVKGVTKEIMLEALLEQVKLAMQRKQQK